MNPLADALRPHMEVSAPNLLGHGGRPIPDRLTIEDTATDVIAYLDQNDIGQTFLFGYSTGGLLALYLARHFPERFTGVCGLAAKYVFDQRTVTHWTHLTNPDRYRRHETDRALELAERHHPENWVEVLNRLRDMFVQLGQRAPISEDDLRAIRVPVLLFASDQDQIVPLEESLALGELIPGAKLVLFKGQSHPFNIVPVAPIVVAMRNWMGEVSAAA